MELPPPPKRFYLDTSVYGGLFDDEFKDDTAAFFARLQEVEGMMIVSPLLVQELKGSPPVVRGVLDGLPKDRVSLVPDSEAADRLAASYLEAKVLSQEWFDDALHVASATLYKADLIVSWNFKHFVKAERIEVFNAVNKSHGYGSIDIRSPKEVFRRDED